MQDDNKGVKNKEKLVKGVRVYLPFLLPVLYRGTMRFLDKPKRLSVTAILVLLGSSRSWMYVLLLLCRWWHGMVYFEF